MPAKTATAAGAGAAEAAHTDTACGSGRQRVPALFVQHQTERERKSRKSEGNEIAAHMPLTTNTLSHEAHPGHGDIASLQFHLRNQ